MLYIAAYHTHKLVVLLFLIIYVIKTVLLVSGSIRNLNRFSKFIKIFEIIVSITFLATGVYLATSMASISFLFILKLVFILGAIPLAIIAFKKKKKVLALISLVLIIGAYGFSEVNKARLGKRKTLKVGVVTNPKASNYQLSLHGKALYTVQCVICHGESGTKGLSGAKDLTISKHSNAQIQSIINNGKNSMPKMKGKFTAQELKALTAYVKKLRE